jgi:hypothetical protein
VLHVKKYSVSHLSDRVLEQEMLTCDDRDRTNLAELLARLAEFDARRLYVPAGFPSMYRYCLDRLNWCEQMACKRIRAARTAAKFPAIFPAVAKGQLHLSAVVLLKPCLTEENADELLAAAVGKTRAQLERLLAERFPQPDVPCRIEALGPSPSLVLTADPLSLGTVDGPASQPTPRQVEPAAGELSPGTVASPGSHRMGAPGPRPKVTPLSPGRFSVQFTMDQEMHDDLCHAQELLSHQIASGDVAKVLHRGLKALISKLEKRKFGATDKPRRGRRRSTGNIRYIPAHVRRAVKERDGGQCTFVSESGRRCGERRHLETLWNDGLAVVASSCLREEKPTAVARGHLDRGLAPAAPEPHTRGARLERERYHLRRDGRTQEGDQRGDAAAGAERAGRVAVGQRAGRDPATGEEAPAGGAGRGALLLRGRPVRVRPAAPARGRRRGGLRGGGSVSDPGQAR